MDAIRFTQKYDQYLDEIQTMVRNELIPFVEELSQIDPHDLIRPDTYFQDENHARGFVWSLFLKRALHKL